MSGLKRGFWLAPLAVSLGGLASAWAQITETAVRLTLDPAMVKGSPTAPAAREPPASTGSTTIGSSRAQPNFERADLRRYVSDLGIPVGAFAQCLDGGRFRSLVEADVEQGRRLGVSGTPTFFINGVPLEGAAPFKAFKQVIDMVLPGGGKR